ncbi:hypothetical protein FIBSPDRAFT_936384 [Athelia psychrophila]|uniref:DUF6533 domain-containing protein n=1 Tax=Athelia psychrophila TaxID=1759441 RepID=A0A166C5K4_9AGAM|nr:hypothetical protein FIBSPDRAFT_936384 [Fibularhizoctonia sp. CBS 109695]
MAMKLRSTGPMPFQPTGPDAFNEQLLCYLVASNFAWYTYDWLLSTSEEVEIVSSSGLSWSIVIYFLSRISEFGHVLMVALFVHIELNRHTVAPVGGCEALGVLLAICAVVSIACTSFLFFLRVRAVYLQARSITVIFGTLWLVMVAINIFDGTSIHPTISYRLAADAVAAEKGWRSHFRLIAGGKGLHRLSGLLMRSGLFYYLCDLFLLGEHGDVGVTIDSSYHSELHTRQRVYHLHEYHGMYRIPTCGALQDAGQTSNGSHQYQNRCSAAVGPDSLGSAFPLGFWTRAARIV